MHLKASIFAMPHASSRLTNSASAASIDPSSASAASRIELRSVAASSFFAQAIVAAVEDAYGVSFTPRDIRSIRSIEDLRALLRSRDVAE